MIRLIAAIDNHNGIAKDGVQPWQLPTDERYFLDQTRRFGENVLMGHTTYEVIGHPLKDRNNFVLSSSRQDDTQVTWIANLGDFLSSFTEDVWVIGGQKLYEQTLDYASELYLTEIDRDYDSDKFFPHFDASFHLQGPRTEIKENGTRYRFCVYVRND
jgi:dihydrofolate reductase